MDTFSPDITRKLACISILVFGCFGLEGTKITWDGGGAGNDWSTAANWDTDTVPTDHLTTDGAFFEGDTAVNFTSDVSIGQLGVGNGSTGTLYFNTSNGSALTIGKSNQNADTNDSSFRVRGGNNKVFFNTNLYVEWNRTDRSDGMIYSQGS